MENIINHDELIHGHGKLEGIVSVQANKKGMATVWQRNSGVIQKSEQKYQPFNLIWDERLIKGIQGAEVVELKGDLPMKYLININNSKEYESFIVKKHLEIRGEAKLYHECKGVYIPNQVEQYLLQTGNSYYRGLKYEDILRVQFDIETTGLDINNDKIFMISVKSSDGDKEVFYKKGEKQLLWDFRDWILRKDPDVIENHNIFNFDLPFMKNRFEHYKIPFNIGRTKQGDFSYKASFNANPRDSEFVRMTFPGREVVDTLQSALRYKKINSNLKNCKLKYLAEFFGVASPNRTYIEGSEIFKEFQRDPEKVARYAFDDVCEVDELSKILNQDRFALAQLVPMTYEKICTSGNVRIVEYPLVRYYLSRGHSMPAPEGESEDFEGGYVKVYKLGYVENVTKIDVASMYPSIMINNKIGPKQDPLNIFIERLAYLKDKRIDYKNKSKTDKSYGPLEKALKVIINASYGYLGAEISIFGNRAGAANVTEIGRNIIEKIETAVAKEGCELLESDTDGVICKLKKDLTPKALSDIVQAQLSEFKGIIVEPEDQLPYKSMYIYAKKNYAYLKSENGNDKLVMVGREFKSNDRELLFQSYLESALMNILNGDAKQFVELYNRLYFKINSGGLSLAEIAVNSRKKSSSKNSEDSNVVEMEESDLSVFKNKCYKSKRGEKPANEYNDDYNSRHYIRVLKKKVLLFRYAFDRNIFEVIQGSSQIKIDQQELIYMAAEESDCILTDENYLDPEQASDICYNLDWIFSSLNPDINIEFNYVANNPSDPKTGIVSVSLPDKLKGTCELIVSIDGRSNFTYENLKTGKKSKYDVLLREKFYKNFCKELQEEYHFKREEINDDYDDLENAVGTINHWDMV